MKKLLFVVLGIVAIFASSCASINTNDGAAVFKPETVPNHYKAITEVGEDLITAQVSSKALFKIFTWGLDNNFADNGDFGNNMSVMASLQAMSADAVLHSKLKKAAVYRACQENDCDYLLNAKYVIKNNDYFFYSNVTCTVTGYPVKIKGYTELHTLPGCTGCQK